MYVKESCIFRNVHYYTPNICDEQCYCILLCLGPTICQVDPFVINWYRYSGCGISQCTLCCPKISRRRLFFFFLNAGLLENAHFFSLAKQAYYFCKHSRYAASTLFKCMSFFCEEKQLTEGINQSFVLETGLSSK